MESSLSLDAKEVLYHLNYMGYRNVTKDQLKFFMTDLKKLIKYETCPGESTDSVIPSAHGSSSNFNRLFESHTICSKNRKIEDSNRNPKSNKIEIKAKTDNNMKSKVKNNVQKEKQPLEQKITKDPVGEKENIPTNKSKQQIPPQDQLSKRPGSKMWIRAKSAQPVKKSVSKNNPVDLYNAYQKDWIKFKVNMCESSHSDLRWSIREKMLGKD
ncbi:unnamed protein product [Diamesa serratosioi]